VLEQVSKEFRTAQQTGGSLVQRASVAGAPVLLQYRGRQPAGAGELDAVGGSPGTDRFEVDGTAGLPARRALPAHLACLADVAVESTHVASWRGAAEDAEALGELALLDQVAGRQEEIGVAIVECQQAVRSRSHSSSSKEARTFSRCC
jgi:hypothetical protein